MKYIIMFFIMFYLHLIDDFHLQGFLGDLKQKSWWKKNYPDKLYEHDWVFALFEHSFSWSFTTHIPLLIISLYSYYANGYLDALWVYVLCIVFNTVTHMIIDNSKANKLEISLSTDQMFHIAQIVFSLSMYGFLDLGNLI